VRVAVGILVTARINSEKVERASDSHTVPLIFVRLVERREKWKFWEKGNFGHDSHLSQRSIK